VFVSAAIAKLVGAVPTDATNPCPACD
jgi:hypothetical protein